MPPASAEPATPGPTLAYVPLPLLAVPMGLGGLGLAWRQFATGATSGFPWAWIVAETLMAMTVLAWIVVNGLHAARALRHPFMAREDWRHPFRGSFAGAIAIGLMLVASCFLPYAPALARALLLAAIALQAGIGLALLARVMRGEGSAEMLAPPLLIPLVGHIVASVFAPSLGMPQLGWMLFGLGGTLWLVLQPLMLGRLFEGAVLSPPLRPALFILLAPPAVGALAAESLMGQGPLMWALYGFAVFVLALLTLSLRFMTATGFNPGWWAFTFPLAAFTTATQRLAPGTAGGAMLVICTLAIGGIALRTLAGARGYFRAP